jgi:hypothetical protein
MLKKSLFAVAAVAMLAVVAQAGELKVHDPWPTGGWIPQEIPDFTIPVRVDIGYWVHVKDQGNVKIKMGQDSYHTYSGCDTMDIECNFNLTLSVSIQSKGVVGGNYSCSVNPANVDSPGGQVTVCAELKNAKLGDVSGGSKNVHVADIKVKVVPR